MLMDSHKCPDRTPRIVSTTIVDKNDFKELWSAVEYRDKTLDKLGNRLGSIVDRNYDRHPIWKVGWARRTVQHDRQPGEHAAAGMGWSVA
jgi:hypothetical protein